jgi:glutathione synthase/RimK-type ligase-like ATP-grasp enzyme
MGLGVLARMAFNGADFTALSAQLMERAAANPRDANALLDLSTILHLTGWRDLGLTMQQEAFAITNIFTLLPKSGQSRLRVLNILAPGDLTENNAIEFLLEAADITLDMFYFSPDGPTAEFTAVHYDAIFVAVCESDRNRPILQDIATYLEGCTIPVINAPAHIARLSRDVAATLLPQHPGLLMPVTARAQRAELAELVEGRRALADMLPQGAFPLIVRPVDSHKGQGLEQVKDLAALGNYLLRRGEEFFYVARYLDYASADGQFRKYRIVLIAGRPYVCHVAISSNWMVHYMSAGMKESAEKRAEEAHVMATFDDEFARRHAEALAVIAHNLALDYVGLDCAENLAGELVIFEFDSGMTVHSMDPSDLFPYKAPQMQKVFKAFADLLFDAASSGAESKTPH